jgi:hypothetical protein
VALQFWRLEVGSWKLDKRAASSGPYKSGAVKIAERALDTEKALAYD